MWDHIAAQVLIVVGVLTAVLMGPAVAIGMLVLRKRRARARRRSPLGIQLLRSPGHTLRSQIEEASHDLAWDVFTLMALPLLLLTVFLAQAHVRTLEKMLSLAPIYGVAILGLGAWQLVKMFRAGQRLDNLRAGIDAEVAVGEELNQLMRQGAVVFHDFPGEGFNIDHVVISIRGVFAVETKGYTKAADARGKDAATVTFDGSSLAFPRWKTSEPIAQAERQAKWLSRWLQSATGDAISVTPVVALPGWFVDRKGRGDVRVYSGRELAQLLSAVGTKGLTVEAMQRVVHQVEAKCRDVSLQFTGQR